ncbi:receptor-type tyrosine-protein phosphatase mu, partial [Plakobranchus ocellatus]
FAKVANSNRISLEKNWVTEYVNLNAQTNSDKHKNRCRDILPEQAHRAKLKCEKQTCGSYINAVLVPSLTRTRQDILTQLPLPSTVTDFWRLVTQDNIGLVVALQEEATRFDETVGQFLPPSDTEVLKDELFEIKSKQLEERPLWREVDVTVHTNKRKSSTDSRIDPHNVKCLVCKNTRSDPELVFDLLEKVKSCRPTNRPRTVYMCRDGAEYSGLLCVQSILLDRLKTDHFLAVPLVVGPIKAVRPQVIPTVDQYKCLYDVIKLVHNSAQNCAYMNVQIYSRPDGPRPGVSKESATHNWPRLKSNELSLPRVRHTKMSSQ